MNPKEAIGPEIYRDTDGTKKGLPLFNEKELLIVEDLLQKMSGMAIDDINAFLKKIKIYLIQAFTV